MWPVSVTRPSLELAGFRRPWTRGRPSAHAVVGRLVDFCVWPSRGCGNVFVAVAVGSQRTGCRSPAELVQAGFGPHEAPPRLVLSIAVFSARHRPRVRSNVSVFPFWLLGLASSRQRRTPGIVWGRSGAEVGTTAAVVTPSTGRPSLHPGGAAGDPGPASGSLRVAMFPGMLRVPRPPQNQ